MRGKNNIFPEKADDQKDVNKNSEKRRVMQDFPHAIKQLRDMMMRSPYLRKKQPKRKKRRFLPLTLLICILVFIGANIASLIGGESAEAATQQGSQTNNAPTAIKIVQSATQSVQATTDYAPDTILRVPLSCMEVSSSSSTTTSGGSDENSDQTTTSNGTSRSSVTPDIPLGDPMPECKNDVWICPDGFVLRIINKIAVISGDENYYEIECLSAMEMDCDDSEVMNGTGDDAPICDFTLADRSDGIIYCNQNYRLSMGYMGPRMMGPINWMCWEDDSDSIFPCSDNQNGPQTGIIRTDWLSGSLPVTSRPEVGGRFLNTFPMDTFNLKGVQDLKPYTMAIGLLLLTPVLIMIGYQVMLGGIVFKYANALQAIPRLVMGVGILVVSFLMTEMLITITNTINQGIVALHQALPYPNTTINGTPIAYTLGGDTDPTSYRGIVMPMSRWGCAANKFMAILAVKFVMDVLASIIPLFGNLVHLAGTIATFFMFIESIGEFALMVMSIMLWAQVLVRIVLLNYYILIAPIAFGCWALPGGYGQNVVGQWSKGFFSVLAIQVIQVFIITTMPLIIPVLPSIPADSFGLMEGILTQLPPVIVLWMTLRAPSILGTTTAKAVTQAGSVAGGVVTAVGATAYSVV